MSNPYDNNQPPYQPLEPTQYAPQGRGAYPPPPPQGQPNYGPGGQPNYGPGGQPNYGPGGQPNYGPGMQPPYMQQPPRRKTNPLGCIISAVVVVLIVGGIFAWNMFQGFQKEQAKSHYPFSADVAFDESLNSSDDNWYTGQGCNFADSSYQMKESEKDYYLMCSRDKVFTNYTYEITMKDMQGAPDSMGGILVDWQHITKDALMFLITKDGKHFGLYKHKDLAVDESEQFKSLKEGNLPETVSFPVKLAVKADDSNLTFYVNEKEVYKTSREDHSGQIGTAILCGSSPTTIDFTNAKLWKLDN
ncbi:hypothetical protein EI42_04898 [Thermosporothrix hazakensis]|jgi:hypothetical protein|uniref:3-keto-disaccharide hydrolase domain-containing protein n=1 Tax=Thermosporothrix hazakensis TaxID=644383 RepID=A0A326U1D9_THEHA|nr:hypothetical protein [Thermosporothrix hazakensis]PZW23515.1 hypothetical protein EI42_04898 [Thermosporothrix hazakensis]GCE51117.1 hypothetical protein KTH_59860 [Thermosporothrix hazakensis]